MKNPLQIQKMQIDRPTAQALGKVFWKLMENWGLKAKDQALLLGVKYHAGKLNKYHSDQIIPEDPDKFLRVGHLAGIHKNLRIIFPYNRQAVYNFMQTPQNFLFNGKSPIEIIREGSEINSFHNIAAIRRRLDQLRV
jgi:hypothetical protein